MQRADCPIQLSPKSRVVEVNTFDNIVFNERLGQVLVWDPPDHIRISKTDCNKVVQHQDTDERCRRLLYELSLNKQQFGNKNSFSFSCKPYKTFDYASIKKELQQDLCSKYCSGMFGRGIVVSDNMTVSYHGSDGFLAGAQIGRPNDCLFDGLITNPKCPFVQYYTGYEKRYDVYFPPLADCEDKLSDLVFDVNQEILNLMQTYTPVELEKTIIQPVLERLCAAYNWTVEDNQRPKLELLPFYDSSVKAYRYCWDSCNLRDTSSFVRCKVQESIFDEAMTQHPPLFDAVKQFWDGFLQLTHAYPVTYPFPYLGSTVALLFSICFMSKNISCKPTNITRLFPSHLNRQNSIAIIKRLVLYVANNDYLDYNNLNLMQHFKRRLRCARLFLVLDPAKKTDLREKHDKRALLHFLVTYCQTDVFNLSQGVLAKTIDLHLRMTQKGTGEVIVLVLDRIRQPTLDLFRELKQHYRTSYQQLMDAEWLWKTDDVEWFKQNNPTDYQTLVVDNAAIFPQYTPPLVSLQDIVCKTTTASALSSTKNTASTSPKKRRKPTIALKPSKKRSRVEDNTFFTKKAKGVRVQKETSEILADRPLFSKPSPIGWVEV